MKKWLVSLLVVFILLTVSACSLNPTEKNKQADAVTTYYRQATEAEKWRLDKIAFERIEAIKSNNTEMSTFPAPPGDVKSAKQKIISLIANKKYREASIDFFGKQYNNSELETLEWFAFALWSNSQEDYYSRNSAIEYFLSPLYKGALSEQMNSFALKFADVGENLLMGAAYVINKNKTHKDELKKVRIGMTKFQVYNSDWGLPNKKSRTTTQFGVTQKYEYNDSRYIVLKDDIVTEIHE
jgi:hypothetical protein